MQKKIHRFTEKGYFALGLDKVSEIIKYQGLLRSLKGVDYFSTMQQAINRYIEKQKIKRYAWLLYKICWVFFL